MQRVRKFLIVKGQLPAGSRLSPSALSSAASCEGWHQSWDTAVQWMTSVAASDEPRESEVAIVDGSASMVIATFSQGNLESLEPAEGQVKWRSVKVASGGGFWCNLNYSDYGWGWVSGAKREVPFRLRFLERQAESNPSGLLSRARAWILEARDWFYGHDRKIG